MNPTVAPFESCIVCFKGDVDTAVGFQGPAEWILAGLEALGVPKDQCYGTLRAFLEEDGWEGAPGEVPDGELLHYVRVCRECVKKCPANFPVSQVGGPITPVSPA